jgi:peptidyl-prolyl cis-trans isomerase D
MAVIGKIRSKAGLLIGIIGFSLVAFILGDLLTSNRSFIKGDSTTAGSIGGNKISIQDFEARVQQNIEKYKISQGKDQIDNQTTEQLRDQTWGQILNEELVGKQIAKTGLVVSSDELFDMVQGKNIHPQIKQAFSDPKTGEFNTANVVQFLKNMDNDQTGRTRAQWLNFESSIEEERLSQKYYDLIKKGLYVTKEEAKRDVEAKGKIATVRYVMLNYNSIADSTVTLSDADLKKAYNENIEKYKQTEETRKLEYVVFDVIPSADDRNAAEKDITKMLEGFKVTTEDSLFVVQNSDMPADNTYHKTGTLSPAIDGFMFQAEVGQLTGPYMENNAFHIAKLTGIKNLPDSVQARHILFKTEGKDSLAVKATADSIYNLIKKGGKFEQFANLSEDPGSAIKGGDLGWFKSGMMVPEFNDFCFEQKKGALGVVKTTFGYHIIDITNQGGMSKQVKVAIVSRKIEASSKTYQTIFANANDFAAKNASGDNFEKAVKEGGITSRNIESLRENDKNVPGIDNARELVRWAFKAKKNEVSKPFELGEKFVVAHLTQIKAEGTLPMSDVKEQVEVEARKNKKAEMLIEKINATGAAQSLDGLAAKLGQPVQNLENVTMGSPYLPNLGMEMNVVGTIFGLKKSAISKPVVGEQGVFVLQLNDIKEPDANAKIDDNKKQLESQVQNRSQYETFNALKEKAKVKDMRGKFY